MLQRARCAQVIQVFSCDVAELLDYFAEEMYEPSWGVEEDERRRCLLQSLERTLRSENSSLTRHEVHVPDVEPPDELPATPGWRERMEQASADFRFASAVAELALLLRESDHRADAQYARLIERARAARGPDADGYRAEFVRLAEAAAALAGEPLVQR